MRRGRTIAGKREKVVSDSERQKAKRRTKKRRAIRVTIVVLLVALIVGLTVRGVKGWLDYYNGKDNAEQAQDEPVVEIVDQNSSDKISDKMKKYVNQLAGDLKDLGYKVERVILPKGMMREVDVQIEGVAVGYIKTNLDRETATTAEDIDKMVRYLSERGISAEYVDVRVVGKGYYK